MEERKYWYHVKRIGKVYGKKIELILATWVDTIDKLGYKIRQASLLTYPDYVIFKGFEIVIDIQRIRYGLKWNVHATLFDPKSLSQSQTGNMKENIRTKETQTINQHNRTTEVPKRQWMVIKKHKKSIKTQHNNKISNKIFRKDENSYNSLSEELNDDDMDNSQCEE